MGRSARTTSRGSIERAVGERIHSLRDRRALSQAALARLARMSQSNLARIEVGDRSATLASLSRVARALQVDLAELVSGVSPLQKPPRAEKLWFRLCDRLRERDERFLRGVDRLVRALELAVEG